MAQTQHSFLRHARRFWRLRWRHKLVLAQAMLAMPAVALLMRVMGYRPAKNLLWRLTARRAQNPSTPWSDPNLQNTVQLAAFAADHTIGKPTCLTRSLVLWWMLRGQGIPTEIKIGVRPARAGGQKIEAHAWLEKDDRVLNDSPAAIRTYAVFDTIPDLPLNAF